MNALVKSLSAITLSLSAAAALASPSHLITHNKTDMESNAFVDGIPSAYPSRANADSKVEWNLVKFICYGHTDKNNQCLAQIKMATNTPNPIVLGVLSMDMKTGIISPSSLSANGYTITVNGPGESTITKN